jgi:hypothetical protein
MELHHSDVFQREVHALEDLSVKIDINKRMRGRTDEWIRKTQLD